MTADTNIGIHIGAPQSDRQHDVDLLHGKVDHSVGMYNDGQIHEAVWLARKSVMARPVIGAGGSLDAWFATYSAARRAFSKLSLPGVQKFEVWDNEEAIGYEHGVAYGKFASRLYGEYGIVPGVGVSSIGQINETNSAAEAKGFKEQYSGPFIRVDNGGAAIDFRMWLLPDWQGEAVNNPEKWKEPFPDPTSLDFAALKDEIWLGYRPLRYIEPWAEQEGFMGYAEKEVALGHIKSDDWDLKYESYSGVNSLLPLWEQHGIEDPEQHFVDGLVWYAATGREFCKQLGFKFWGANVWLLGKNYKFSEHDITGRTVELLVKAAEVVDEPDVPPPDPEPIPIPDPPTPTDPPPDDAPVVILGVVEAVSSAKVWRPLFESVFTFFEIALGISPDILAATVVEAVAQKE